LENLLLDPEDNFKKIMMTGVENLVNFIVKKLYLTRHQWLTSVILDTQKAEIKRISVQSQPQANSS
jgi:hypothetical protein